TNIEQIQETIMTVVLNKLQMIDNITQNTVLKYNIHLGGSNVLVVFILDYFAENRNVEYIIFLISIHVACMFLIDDTLVIYTLKNWVVEGAQGMCKSVQINFLLFGIQHKSNQRIHGYFIIKLACLIKQHHTF
ncbi:hypothetical protein ACJX0J_014949, partial [Zea mays]